jgi:hypothetical protein
MIVVLGLLVLAVAATISIVAVASNGGGGHPLGGDFTVAGLHLSGLSTGQLFLYGVVVGTIGMLGLSMLLGTFSQRMASRSSRRRLKGSQLEAEALRVDHERLSQQLDDERAGNRQAIADAADGDVTDDAGSAGSALPGHVGSASAAANGATANALRGERPGLLQRLGQHAGGRR